MGLFSDKAGLLLSKEGAVSARKFYQVIGVKENATEEQIKKAYRKKARKLHPDAGGDNEKFLKLQQAYEVLIDPARRRRYDETGEFDEGPVNGVPPHVVEVLQHAMWEVLWPTQVGPYAGCFDTDPVRENLKTRMLDHMGRTKAELKDRKKEFVKRKKTAEKVLGRFKSKDENNVMEGMTKSLIATLDHNIETSDQALKELQEAIDFLKEYEYTTDKGPADKPDRVMKMLGGSGYFTFKSIDWGQ
jgi:hypothetical protein